MTKMESKGEVIGSESKARGCGGRITLIKLLNTSTSKEKDFNLVGQHRIDIGETILVAYETHSKINWVSKYAILDEKGLRKYSSTCE